MNDWNARYDTVDYLFGTEPNAFLVRRAGRIAPRSRVLALADGEGRNGVWLAGRGHRVHSVDASDNALAKARRLADARGVELDVECVDLAGWAWPRERYDAVVAIFVQFAPPDLRRRMFAGILQALVPGGVLLLEGYRPEQIAYGTGGPGKVEQLYTEPQLRRELAGFAIERIEAYDAVLAEGSAHRGPSALIDCVARRPG